MRKQIGKHKINIQHPKSEENTQESGSVGDISNGSSKYETIDENDTIMPMILNNPEKHRRQSITMNRKSATQSYLEVISDDVYSASKKTVTESESCFSVTSSLSNIKNETVKSTEPCTDIYIDAEKASYHAIKSSYFQEPKASNSHEIHLNMNSANTLTNSDDNSLTTMGYTNNYFTLNTSDTEYTHSYCLTVNPGLNNMVHKREKVFTAQKRHSCP